MVPRNRPTSEYQQQHNHDRFISQETESVVPSVADLKVRKSLDTSVVSSAISSQHNTNQRQKSNKNHSEHIPNTSATNAVNPHFYLNLSSLQNTAKSKVSAFTVPE